MARDYEDIYDLSSMDDDEIRELIREQLSDYDHIDPDDVEVSVENGRVTLSGRVGTEHDYQAIEHVVTDVIGIKDVANELLVDETRRGEQPEAADEATAERIAADGGSRAGANRTEDTAEHLLRDTAAEQQGTDDMGAAIERGYSYNPPTRPVQEGVWSKEDH